MKKIIEILAVLIFVTSITTMVVFHEFTAIVRTAQWVMLPSLTILMWIYIDPLKGWKKESTKLKKNDDGFVILPTIVVDWGKKRFDLIFAWLWWFHTTNYRNYEKQGKN